jgi:hypothetical protein
VKEAIPPNAFPLRGCWSMYVCWLWPCWWQAYVTTAYGILDISKYGWHRLFGIRRSNPQAKLAYLVLSLLLAMKQGMEALWGLWYKLWMMGVQINGPSYIYGDNMSVIHNTQWPESTLKKLALTMWYASQLLWVNP